MKDTTSPWARHTATHHYVDGACACGWTPTGDTGRPARRAVAAHVLDTWNGATR